MSIKSWRPSWTTPGQSELNRPWLDLTVNRDLLVKRNLHVKGNFQLDGNFAPWQSYTPTMHGYQAAAGGGTLATGITYTSTGRYRKLGTTVAFEFVVQITTPRSPNWASNAYIDLPTKTNFQFTTSGAWQVTGANNDSQWYGLFGVAKAGTNSLIVVPTQNVSTAIVTISTYSPPIEITASGLYELTP
jgi:hypothetical protein